MRQTSGTSSRAAGAGLLVVLLAGLAALWPSAVPAQAATRAPAAATTMVRLLHAAPAAPAVDVYFGGQRVFGNAAYKDFSNYEPVAPGRHQVTLYPGGTDLYSGGRVPKPIETTEVIVPPGGGSWTMVAIARGGGVGFTWVKDDLSVPDSSKARVRFVHVSPGTPAVDVEVSGTDYMATGVAYGRASAYGLVDASTTDVLVHPSGWAPVVATKLAKYQIQSGHVYSFYIIGTLAGGLSILSDVTATQAMVRVLHAVPGAGPVDVFIAGERAFGDAGYGDVSPYTPVAANAQKLTVYPPNPDVALPKGTKLLDTSINFTPDMTYTLVLLNQSGKLAALSIPDDTSPPDAGLVKVRLVHLSPDAPSVDVALSGLGVQFAGVSYGTAVAYNQVKPGTYVATVHPAGKTSTVLLVPGLVLQKGHVYTIFLLGQLKGKPALYATLEQDV
jgi:hypothetical protein